MSSKAELAKSHLHDGFSDAGESTTSAEGAYELGKTDRSHVPSRREINAKLDEIAAKYGVSRKRMGLKADCWIVLPICILYLLAFLDRVNISNARVYGLEKDLKLHGNQFYTALTIFFVPYIVFEVPSNYLLKKFKPHVWLSANMFLFGCVSIAQGFVRNYGGLITTRFLLGILETGMFPGCFYLLSAWYRREEAQKRYSFFFSSTSLAGAFGGLIAYRMNNLAGKRGLESWRWLFIVEGAVTVFMAIILFFLIADFPEDAKFLTENERAYVREKLALDSGDSYFAEKMEIKRLFSVFKDWKVWVSGFQYFGLIVPAYAYAFFAPTIINQFGYSPVKTQVFSIFPWITSFGTSMIWAYFSDLTRHRFGFVIVLNFFAIAGFALLLGLSPVKDHVHARYAGCFLICVGLYAAMPLIVCWTNLNFAGHYRKMVGSAWQVGFGNIGGIVSTYIFPTPEGPKYTKGYSVCIAMTAFSLASSAAYFSGVYWENRERREGKRDEAFEHLSDKDKALAGDLNPNFIYQY